MGMVTPYVHLAYEYDLRKAPRGGGVALVGSPTAETDRHALRWGFGLDANLSERLVGTLEFSSVTVKDNYDEVTFLANLNWAF